METRVTRVLIVDDAEGFRKLMVILLSRLTTVEVIGHAKNCHEARAAIRTLQPDVVLLDLHMPDGSGLDVLRDVKKELHAPIVVMCTSDSDRECRRRCLEEGADFYLDKLTDVSRWEQLFAMLS